MDPLKGKCFGVPSRHEDDVRAMEFWPTAAKSDHAWFQTNKGSVRNAVSTFINEFSPGDPVPKSIFMGMQQEGVQLTSGLHKCIYTGKPMYWCSLVFGQETPAAYRTFFGTEGVYSCPCCNPECEHWLLLRAKDYVEHTGVTEVTNMDAVISRLGWYCTSNPLKGHKYFQCPKCQGIPYRVT